MGCGKFYGRRRKGEMADSIYTRSIEGPLQMEPDRYSQQGRDQDNEHPKREGSSEGRGHDAEGFDDRAAFLGIPENQLTQPVRDALARLSGEMERLRREIRRFEEREKLLRQEADQDARLPVLSYRAFAREVSRVVRLSVQSQTAAWLVYFDIQNADDIKKAHGHRALEAAMIHASLLLTAEVRTADVVGNLGHNDFGVVLAVADAQGVEQKAADLAEKLKTRPFFWKSEAVAFDVSYGIHRLQEGETSEAAIEEADRASRK